MIRQVFEAVQTDSRKGDFYNLVQLDMADLGMDHTEEDVIKIPKLHWKNRYTVKPRKLSSYIEYKKIIKTKTKEVRFEKFKEFFPI